MEEIKREIARRIKEVRKKLKLNQESFGREIGVSKSAVSKYEQGDAFPQVETLFTIVKLGKISFEYLMTGIETGGASEGVKPAVSQTLSNGEKEAIQTAENVLRYAHLDERFSVAEFPIKWEGPSLTEEEKELLGAFRQVDQNSRNMILQVANNTALAFKQGAGRSRPGDSGTPESNCA